jgi:E3 ubiquitin ligase
MPPDIDFRYVALLLASLAALLYTGYRFFHRWHESRLFEDTPQSRVRSAAQGYVKLTGIARALPGTPMRAPLSDRACVWWSFSVEERVSTFGRSRWQRTDGGTSDTPFLLADADSQCLINPLEAEIEPSENNVWVCGAEQYRPAGREPSGALSAALSSYGVAGERRLQESLILENAPVSAIGVLRTDDGGASNAVGDEAAVLLSEWKHDQQALLARFDTDHDGRLNASEWEAVRAAAVEQVEHNRLHQGPVERLRILGKPADGRPYVIAALSAEALAQREARRAYAALALVVICLAVSCYALSQLHIS